MLFVYDPARNTPLHRGTLAATACHKTPGADWVASEEPPVRLNLCAACFDAVHNARAVADAHLAIENAFLAQARSGATYHAIARESGVGLRTLSRYIAEMLRSNSVRSVVDLAYRAGRHDEREALRQGRDRARPSRKTGALHP